MRYISRTVNATENLIWYSESTINSLSPMYPQIFSHLSSSGWKIGSKTVNFHAFFEWFLAIFSSTSWLCLMKLGQKWDKMDTKKTQKTRCQNFEPFWRYLGSKLPKIDQNRPKFYGWSKKFSKNFFFAFLEFQYFNSQKKSNKIFFGRFSPLWWSGT